MTTPPATDHVGWAARWEGALCAQADPELWTPPKGGSVKDAKTICRRCPFGPKGDDSCLTLALEQRYIGSDTGVWGATSPRQRARMLQEVAA